MFEDGLVGGRPDELVLPLVRALWRYALAPQIIAGVVFWTGYWLALKAVKLIDRYTDDPHWDAKAFYAAEQAAFRADFIERKRAYSRRTAGSARRGRVPRRSPPTTKEVRMSDAFTQLVVEKERTLFMFYGFRLAATGEVSGGYFKQAHSLN